MRFRRLLAFLVALTLIAGLPLGSAQATGAGCTTVSAAADGCCGAGDIASCSVACSAAVAAVGKADGQVVPLYAGSPLGGAVAQTRSVSHPPDTAPPKLLSA